MELSLMNCSLSKILVMISCKVLLSISRFNKANSA
eukprot:10493.XXX_114627_114731_1 [CDS] Oithona nana genome sequencing.